MAEYESLIHLPRWRRAIIWLCESRAGFALISTVVGAAALAPVFLLGPWWMVVVIVAGVSFAAGWNSARRRWLRGEPIDRI